MAHTDTTNQIIQNTMDSLFYTFFLMSGYVLGMKITKVTDLSLLIVFLSYRVPTSTKMPQGIKTNKICDKPQMKLSLYYEALTLLAETSALLEC